MKKKEIENTPFDKPLFEDIINLCDLKEVEFHPYSASPYITACCPFHDDHAPSFIIFQEIQQCHCRTCHTAYMDVIAFWKLLKNRSFAQTVKDICKPTTVESSLIKKLNKPRLIYVDLAFLAQRVRKVWSTVDFDSGVRVVSEVLRLLQEEKYSLVEKLLVRSGI
ncbi:MAG TPA: CHC2 zinc finger domain-containing protein [Aquella sp.]|nr:CHC2 zinc finger domain-containing protein [Aquella sp.]